MKPASWPVDLPVRKGQLTREEQRHKDMQDTVKEFSFGALGICFLPYILITISTLCLIKCGTIDPSGK